MRNSRSKMLVPAPASKQRNKVLENIQMKLRIDVNTNAHKIETKYAAEEAAIIAKKEEE